MIAVPLRPASCASTCILSTNAVTFIWWVAVSAITAWCTPMRSWWISWAEIPSVDTPARPLSRSWQRHRRLHCYQPLLLRSDAKPGSTHAVQNGVGVLPVQRFEHRLEPTFALGFHSRDDTVDFTVVEFHHLGEEIGRAHV